jgi:hypothetical protein
MVQRQVQLVDGVRPEGVADLGPVERDPDRARVDRPVVGDVGKGEPIHGTPLLRVEDLRNHAVRPSTKETAT